MNVYQICDCKKDCSIMRVFPSSGRGIGRRVLGLAHTSLTGTARIHDGSVDISRY